MKKGLAVCLVCLIGWGCVPQSLVCFTPSPICENNIVQQIETAKTIDVAMYSLNNNAIVAVKHGRKIGQVVSKPYSKGAIGFFI